MSKKKTKSSIKKKLVTFAKKKLAYFNSLQVESRILIVLAGIIAIPVLFYVGLIGYSIINIGQAFNEASSRQDTAEKEWYSLELPSGLEYRNSDNYGDVIDSPESYGWSYNYRHSTNDSDEKVYKEFQQSLKNAGYTITETIDKSTDPDETARYYGVEAVNDKKHVKIYITVSGQKFVYADVKAKY